MATLDQDIMTVLPIEGHEKPLSTPQVRDSLIRLGVSPPSTKTIQRNLDRLEESGHVESMRQGRSLFWHRRKGAHGLGNGKNSMMSFDDALALQILSRFSSQQLPTFVAQSLQPMLNAATRRLATANNDIERNYSRWLGKIAVESGGFRLQTPEIDPDIFSMITRALFQEQRLLITYRPRSSPETESQNEICPLGLVEVGGIVYLIGGRLDKPYKTMYRLNRIADAEISLESFEYPSTFNLNEYVKEQRQFDFFVEGETALTLRFTKQIAQHLLESPMSPDQTYQNHDDHIDVSGTVLLSQRLRWWIRSFGPNVEVLAPPSLRNEFAAEAKALVAVYEGKYSA